MACSRARTTVHRRPCKGIVRLENQRSEKRSLMCRPKSPRRKATRGSNCAERGAAPFSVLPESQRERAHRPRPHAPPPSAAPAAPRPRAGAPALAAFPLRPLCVRRCGTSAARGSRQPQRHADEQRAGHGHGAGAPTAAGAQGAGARARRGATPHKMLHWPAGARPTGERRAP
jgi:hypothetical protein